MDFLRAIIGFSVIIGLALLLGRIDHHKNPELYTYSIIGSVIVLLAMRFLL